MYVKGTINYGDIMTELYTLTYQTGLLTEYFENWDELPNLDKLWADFQTHFTDVKWKMRRRFNQNSKKTGFLEANMMLMNKLDRANDILINMAQTAMTDKEKITMITWTLAEFIRFFITMEEKFDRALVDQTGVGASASTPTPSKYVIGSAYWKADGRHIWDQGRVLLDKGLLREASSQQYHEKLLRSTAMSYR